MTKGRCLCGAVTVTVERPLGEISACHCELCTRWGGGVQFGIEVAKADVTMHGPVKVHRSSEIAERGWCDTCGSALFLRNAGAHEDGTIELCPGIFADSDAGGARLVRVVYADRAIGGIALAGDIKRVTKQDYEAVNPHLT